MTIKWIQSKQKGVRYYVHPTKKYRESKDAPYKNDRCYVIRYQAHGKRYEHVVGWASEKDPADGKHWNELKAATLRAILMGNAKNYKEEKTIADMREKARAEEGEKQAEKDRLEKEAVTFQDFFTNTYLPLAKSSKKERSVEREEGLYSVWIKPIIGHILLKEVAPFHLEIIKSNMANGKKVMKEVVPSARKKTMKEVKQSPRSIEYALAVIRQVFNTAKRSGACPGESPTANVKAPKIDNGRMRFLTKTEATALLNLLNKKSSQDVHDMTLLSLHAGLRFGEIASLTWQDIDLIKGVLTIRDAKAGSRYAFLTPQATDMIKKRDQGKPSEHVFQGRKGKLDRLSLTFFRAVAELKLNEGIDDPRLQICFHSCRHSYASWMIEQGADLYTVQKLLGHKTNVMTQRYAHLSENRLRDAAKALGASWKQDEPVSQQQAQQVVN